MKSKSVPVTTSFDAATSPGVRVYTRASVVFRCSPEILSEVLKKNIYIYIGNDSLALNTRQERTDSTRPECDSHYPTKSILMI
jgi:hypothetical protein